MMHARWMMLAGLTLAGCHNDFLEIQVDGRPVTVHYVTADVEANERARTITWRGHRDPSCNAIDDERTYTVEISIPNVQAVPLGMPIALSAPGAPLSARLTGSCFCAGREGEVNAVYTGAVQFDRLTNTAATGSMDIQVQGDIEFADTGRILHEDSAAAVNVSFDAPTQQDPDCG